MKSVYLIEVDLDSEELKDILSEKDSNVNLKQLRFKTIDDYETFLCDEWVRML